VFSISPLEQPSTGSSIRLRATSASFEPDRKTRWSMTRSRGRRGRLPSSSSRFPTCLRGR